MGYFKELDLKFKEMGIKIPRLYCEQCGRENTIVKTIDKFTIFHICNNDNCGEYGNAKRRGNQR